LGIIHDVRCKGLTVTPERAAEYEATGIRFLREELSVRIGELSEFGRTVQAVGLRGWPPDAELYVEFEDQGKPRWFRPTSPRTAHPSFGSHVT